MLIREFDSDANDGDSNLLTVLEFLRNRSHNKKLTPTISTNSLINMVKNIGGSEWFTYNNLMAAQQNNPAVKELIKNIDREKVTLAPFGDETDSGEQQAAEPETSGPAKDPTKTVNTMAKRALANRA